jgi:uncharacterized FlaG/YvyC family protein
MATIGNLRAADSTRIVRNDKAVDITLKYGRIGTSAAKATARAQRTADIRQMEEAHQSRDSSIGREQAREKVVEQPKRMSLQELAELLRKVNLTFDLFEIQARYIIDKSSGDVSVQIINQRTGEVIRKIPPYDVPKVAEALKNGGPAVTDVMA